jgi:hypothetical protein
MSLKCCLILCSLFVAVCVVPAQGAAAGTPEQVQPVNLSNVRLTVGLRDLQAHLCERSRR